MKTSYKNRLLILTELALGRNRNNNKRLCSAPKPLLVFHSPLMPETDPNEIACARAAGRPIVHVRFVVAEDGKLCLREQPEPPPYVIWGQEKDAPRVIETTIWLEETGTPIVTKEETVARYGAGCRVPKTLLADEQEND